MATVTELRNEAAQALEAAKRIATDGGDDAAYKAAFAAFESKHQAWKNAEQVQSMEATFALKPNEIPTSDTFRDPQNAILPVTEEQANARPRDHIEIAKGTYVPYATDKSEGWMKGRAVAVQHPDILARLSPELREVKAQQEDAFAYYFRNGEAAMRKNRPDLLEPLRALNALQEDTDSEGGYLVPTDQRFEVIRNPGARGGVTRPISTVFNTSRDGGTFPTATSVTWAGIPEEFAHTDSDPAFDQVPFTIRKSGANNRLSMELLQDSAVNIPSLLGTLYGEASGRYEDTQAIEGDGTTEPLGLRVTGTPQGAIADITDVWADPPTALEVVKAYFELPAQWRGNATWHMTSSIMSKIVTIGSAAAGIHFTEIITGAPGLTLLGRPVVLYDGTGWDDAGTLSSGEEVGAIGDFSQYYFVDRMGMSVARDDSVYFATDQIAFKARRRYDSFFALADAFRILKG